MASGCIYRNMRCARPVSSRCCILPALHARSVPVCPWLPVPTKHNAELLGLPELGTLATGQEASLVAVEGDPLQDIHAVKNTRFVLFRGEPVNFAGQFHWP